MTEADVISDRETDVLILPAVLDRQAASDLSAQLKSHLDGNGAVRADASAIEVLTTPCIQLLLAAAKDDRLSVLAPSAEFRSAFDDLGLPMPAEVSVAAWSLDIVPPEPELPAFEPVEQTALPEPESPIAARRILTIDDSKTMRDMLRLTLSDAGYDVIQGVDGQDGLDVLGDTPVDVVITDINMPRMDGLELCQRLRQQKLPHYVYTVLVTGKSRPEEIVQGLEAGADDYLVKPVHRVELLARVRAGGRLLELESRLAELARTDPLTGVPTQRVFYEAAEKEVERVRRYRLPLSCVMLDVDFFKRINDTYGHPVGDQVIRSLAWLLKGRLRASDIIGRYGGEEFLVVLRSACLDEAEAVLDCIRADFATLPHAHATGTLRAAFSAGIACFPAWSTGNDLTHAADEALLEAKRQGRNRVMRAKQHNPAQ